MSRRLLLPLLLVLALTAGSAVAVAATRSVSVTANLKTTERDGLRATQKGPVTVTPLGKGTLTLKTFIQKGRITASFTARIGRSTIRGKATGRVEVEGRMSYDGTATVTGGTGRFKDARARGLKFTGTAPLNGRTSQIRLRGKLTY